MPPECQGTEPDIINSTNQETCDGSLSIEVEAGGNDYTVSWSGPGNFSSNSENIGGLCGGTYTVTVTYKGCTITETYDICCCTLTGGIPQDPDFPYVLCSENNSTAPIEIYDYDITPTTSAKATDGAIDIHITGGISNDPKDTDSGGTGSGSIDTGTDNNEDELYYIWSGPNGFTSNEQDISGIGIGVYCVTITDGCSTETKCFELVDCSQRDIVIDAQVTNTCKGYEYGSIFVSVSGGAAPYKYRWDNGYKSESLTFIGVGTYCLKVIDINGCFSEKCFTISAIPLIPVESTDTCGIDWQCNEISIIELFEEYNVDCSYDDPDDCRVYNCYCSLTGLKVFSKSEFHSYIAEDKNFDNCIWKVQCPDEDWITLEQKSFFVGLC